MKAKLQARSLLPSMVVSLGLCLVLVQGYAQGSSDAQADAVHDHASHDHASHDGTATDEHAGHRMQAAQVARVDSEEDYQVPDLRLVDMNYRLLSLGELLQHENPVILNFIYTTCTTVCPVLSATFSQIQNELGGRENLRMISISIDPDHDSPQRLRDYAQRYRSDDNWYFLTGELDQVIQVQESLDAYRGDKMNHIPLTFLYSSRKNEWIRMEGFASSSEIAAQYAALLAD